MFELTEAQQRVIMSLIRERDQEVARITAALDAAVSAFAAQAGLQGEVKLHQGVPGGPIGLQCLARNVGEPELPEIEPEKVL